MGESPAQLMRIQVMLRGQLMDDEGVFIFLATCFNGYWLCAEVPDQESEDELEGSDLDIALPAFMGESRAQLMRSQETLRGQLAAEVCTEAHSETCHLGYYNIAVSLKLLEFCSGCLATTR